jgi:hypothetical protein
LTNRPVDSWLECVNKTIFVILGWQNWYWLGLLDPKGIGATMAVIRKVTTIWWRGEYGNQTNLRQTYLDDCNHFRELVPKERLLEFESKDGWEPVPILEGGKAPAEPYPRTNHADATVNLLGFMWRLTLFRVMLKVGAYGGVVQTVNRVLLTDIVRSGLRGTGMFHLTISHVEMSLQRARSFNARQ